MHRLRHPVPGGCSPRDLLSLGLALLCVIARFSTFGEKARLVMGVCGGVPVRRTWEAEDQLKARVEIALSGKQVD